MHLLLRTEALAVGGDRLINIVDDVTNTDSGLDQVSLSQATCVD